VRPLGVNVPLRPERHTVAIIRRGPGYAGTHPIISDWPNGAYCRPDGREDTLVGSAHGELEREDAEVEVHRAADPATEADLVSRFLKRFPDEGGASLRRGYTGVYDCTPDLHFVLGPVKAVPGLHLACGFSGHGFKFSPVVGELVAERALTGRNREIDISLFAVERFEEGRLVTPEHPYMKQKV
jgi:glycine/D-amino acid oxidase-like deaminating enzyme